MSYEITVARKRDQPGGALRWLLAQPEKTFLEKTLRWP